MTLSRRVVLASAAALSACTATPRAAFPTQTLAVGNTPFAMPPLRLPVFDGRPRFVITDFGATTDSQLLTSAALARAIAAAHEVGGGTVVVPAGTWRTGPVHLKSRVHLHVEAGATLHFSPDPADYLPAVLANWEGLECMIHSPLIYAHDCEDIAVTGAGTLEAGMAVWRDWFARPRRTWTRWWRCTACR